ncbi:SusC/RagA family TonB-linked outer membrane protein [Flavobacterium sp. xlx-214]|uniref:SusC/RagA family TonB-linked outer membrane protein n=1 Tax=unclassified Flavobacterium TaxID=196869 RepID=UPI0013D04F25|nr:MULTISPECIES: SusC/RagA family TonB-linked outer membrane protein [unclassified Flavobacterium]MBA5792696.1 SusC/RagA family TonB-linked outer membrane protein [Flavobacterium sp. xlx-221]QMI83841.1 SusC/RagA family TonB-linked outer membrane protein [Flavobacterium sp. xlx-214]
MKKITFAALVVPLMWVLLVLLLLSNNKLYAQERTVLSGVVKTVSGTPLEGVTVWQPETNDGTQTNEQGFYSLEIPPNTTVTFEYLGYVTQKIKATNKVLNVTLTEDEDVLDEVVINAGYYTVKDKERTGSISKITAKEIGQQPVANPLAAMQGRMAGVNITQSSGTPGGGFDIQIRGRNSLRTEGNAPLYIVDGVPYLSESQSFSGLSFSILANTTNNPLQLINPDNIESIEVLKDADATAIYGSRGANGVVLITTKKGMQQPTVFSLQSHTAVGVVPRFMKLLNTAKYLDLRRSAFKNDGITEYPANAYDINGTWNQDRYTDWQQELLGGKAVSQQVSASIRGGDKRNSFMLQVSTARDGTVFPGDYGNRRKNILGQFSHITVDDKWKIQTQFVHGQSNNLLPGTDLTREALTLAPNAPALYNLDESLNWENGTWNNPLRWKNQTYSSLSTQWLNAWDIEGKLTKDLTVKLQAGFNESNTEEFKLSPHTINNPAAGLDSSRSTSYINNAQAKGWNIEPQLHYNKRMNLHTFSVLVGTSFLHQESTQKTWYASNFTSNSQLANLSAAKSVQLINNQMNQYNYNAVFARLNYQFFDKYIVNFTGRRDGSSRFGSDRRWGNFGAIGAAWLFSREKLLEGSSWLSFGKLRASYGTAGNDRIGDYQYLDTYGISGGMYDVGGLSPQRLYNPYFSWETNLKKEVALELSLFNNKVSLLGAYYQNESSNQLVGVPLPGTTGFGSIQANLPATVRNSGWEFEARAKLVDVVDWKWSLNGNISFNRNRLLFFPDLEGSTYKNTYAVGHPVSMQYVFEYAGIDPVTGLYTFTDFNGDGKITAADDKKRIIDLTPEFSAGFGQNLSYRNWSLALFFHAVKQQAVGYRAGWGMPGMPHNQPQNYDSELIQNPSAGFKNEATTAYNQFTQSNGILEDASFIRLKNINLSYSIPELFGLKLKGTVYVSGQNVLTWTRYKGLDPESLSNASVPPLKVWSFGFVLNY